MTTQLYLSALESGSAASQITTSHSLTATPHADASEFPDVTITDQCCWLMHQATPTEKE
jgi:hypothetical protein